MPKFFAAGGITGPPLSGPAGLLEQSGLDTATHTIVSGNVVYIVDEDTVDRTEAESIATAKVFGVSEGTASTITTAGIVTINFTTDGGQPNEGDFVYVALASADTNTGEGKATASPPTSGISAIIGVCKDNANYAASKTCEVFLDVKAPIEIVFDPLSITGLELWLDANDTGTLFKNIGKTQLANVDSDQVAIWSDKSGNNIDFIQATGVRQPLFRTGIINGLPTVKGDGINDRLVAGDIASLEDDNFTVFILYLPPIVAASQDTILAIQHNTGTDRSGHSHEIDGFEPCWRIEGIGAAIVVSGVTPPNNVALMQTDRKSGTTGTIYLDGVLKNTNMSMPASIDYSDAGGPGGEKKTVVLANASGPTAFANFCEFHIGEILLYNTSLVTANQVAVENYLRNKWGTP